MSKNNSINFKGVLKGIIFSFIITLILVFAIAIISYFTDISDKIISVLLFISSVLSALIGAFFLTRTTAKNGLIHGVLVGMGYFIIILISSIVMNKKININFNLLTMLIADLAGGMLGGILGINSKE